MKVVTFTEAQERFRELLSAVEGDGEPVGVFFHGKLSVAIVPLADWEALQETAYLLRSPANARRLMASIDQLERGGGVGTGTD